MGRVGRRAVFTQGCFDQGSSEGSASQVFSGVAVVDSSEEAASGPSEGGDAAGGGGAGGTCVGGWMEGGV